MNTLGMGDYAFDTYAKETVKITNGTRDGDNKDTFQATEAIALRVIGYDEKTGRAITAWTYRKVEHDKLLPVTPNKMNSGFVHHKRTSKYFIGRI